MIKKHHTPELKNLAFGLVEKGVTYDAIYKKLGVPKSTLSTWIAMRGRKPDRTRQLAHLSRAREAAKTSLASRKSERLLHASSEAARLADMISITNEEINKSLLAMLYWAEGGKQEGNLKFTNTDPELISLFLSLLRKSYPIVETRLHIALQIHSYHNEGDLVRFWSKKLNISTSQFWKTYLKPRSGRRQEYRRNFYGICNLHYASTPIQRELLALGKALAKRYS